MGAEEEPLRELARQAAAALELAGSYTDVLEVTRRHKGISAAAEIQQNLLPPRIARISGASLAGNVLPSYDVGGDWFDYVDNADGAWLGIADAAGTGPAAAALSSIALGAFRAARRSGAGLGETVEYMHKIVAGVRGGQERVSAIVARWHGPSGTLSWINRGHLPPLIITARGDLEVLESPSAPALGEPGGCASVPQARRLLPGERLILYSNGVSERRTDTGAQVGIEGIRAAAARAVVESAPATVKAIEEAVIGASADPLQDDATLVVLTPTGNRDE
jgi:serine phosphatase RsbU (regulator of sigma subunit)